MGPEGYYLPSMCSPACTNLRRGESWIDVLSRPRLDDGAFVGIGTNWVLLLANANMEDPATFVSRKTKCSILGDSLVTIGRAMRVQLGVPNAIGPHPNSSTKLAFQRHCHAPQPRVIH